MRIYLDVCCLNRPFDDQSQLRVAMETLAIERLLELADEGRIEAFSSEMAWIEIGRMPNLQRRKYVSSLMPPRARTIPLTDEILDNAERLVAVGFSVADAVHLAAAKKLKVDAFVTTDDRLHKRAQKHRRLVDIRVVKPVQLALEFENGDHR